MVHYRWSQFLFPTEKASSLLVKSTESVVRLFARLIVKIRVAVGNSYYRVSAIAFEFLEN